jgi:Na+/melibiose symporter-like transporter
LTDRAESVRANYAAAGAVRRGAGKARDTLAALPFARMLNFGAATLPLSALALAMAISVQPYIAQNLGVGLITISLAFTIVRLLDLGVDVGLAIGMDRTKTRLGRYRIWMVAGTPILMLAVYQLFMAHKGIGLVYLVVWVFVYALGNSMVNLSRSAWSATLITRYDHRSVFYGVLTAIGVLGNLIVIATAVLSGNLHVGSLNTVQLMGWTILALLPLGMGLTAFFTPEPISVDMPIKRFPLRDYWEVMKKPEVLRLFISSFALTLGPGWMSNLYLFFFIAARGFTEPQAYFLLGFYIMGGLVGAPLIGMIGARFSKHRTMIAATIGYSLGLCTIVFTPKANVVAGIPVMLWCGFMGVGFDLMTSAMMADVGDQIRLEQGKERMALLFAVTGLAGKLAAAGALAISYPLLAAVGYIPTLAGHNTPAAIDGLSAVFIIGPIFWVALGGLCFLGWKLDAVKHARIRNELEARDAVLAASEATT